MQRNGFQCTKISEIFRIIQIFLKVTFPIILKYALSILHNVYVIETFFNYVEAIYELPPTYQFDAQQLPEEN